ncbi:MAG: aminoacyl-tRNA hydrolase [Planctomycetota bacterium]|nr:aminoacyl-tRNA hydrolase [Planctomycetota bacterium]MDA1106025.1 aminoacyl-tRNA hydrolase [Planctomycetota bacterium]
MKLVVGLGNPGPEYRRTRHNVGFEVIDCLARRSGLSDAASRSRFSGLVLEAELGGERTLLLKPMTFMNRSGQSVVEAARFYKVDTERDLLVIADDLALPCGQLRLRADGGDGGHNGLADITRALGTPAWARCRIGIDRSAVIPHDEYVLGRFLPEQEPLVAECVDRAADAATVWCQRGATAAMNQFNQRIPGESGPASTQNQNKES